MTGRQWEILEGVKNRRKDFSSVSWLFCKLPSLPPDFSAGLLMGQRLAEKSNGGGGSTTTRPAVELSGHRKLELQ